MVVSKIYFVLVIIVVGIVLELDQHRMENKYLPRVKLNIRAQRNQTAQMRSAGRLALSGAAFLTSAVFCRRRGRPKSSQVHSLLGGRGGRSGAAFGRGRALLNIQPDTQHKSSHKKTRHALSLLLSLRYQARGCFLSAWFAVHSPIFTSRTALNMEAAPDKKLQITN